MDTRIVEIAQRIKGLREMMGLSIEEMAKATDTAPEEYARLESGMSDFSFTFLYKVAEKYGVDLMEIVTGAPPRLSFYTIVRKDKGLPIKRRAGFEYQHLAPLLKNKLAEPFLVIAPYNEAEQDQPIHLSKHAGQEMDYVLEGSLKIAMENHVETLNPGDCIFYDSGHGHGMIATGGSDCRFLAVVFKDREGR